MDETVDLEEEDEEDLVEVVDEEETAEDQESDDFEEEEIKITGHSPNDDNQLVEEGGITTFSIDINKNNPDIFWYVDGGLF